MPAFKMASDALCSEGLLSPFVLFLDLCFFLRGEIVLDAEVLSEFLDRLALDIGGDLCARQLEEWLTFEVFGGHDELKELLLLEVDVVGIPWFDELVHIVVREGLVNLGWLMVKHAGAEDHDLFKNWLLDLGEWDLVLNALFLDKTLDEVGFLSDINWDFDGLKVAAEKFDVGNFSNILCNHIFGLRFRFSFSLILIIKVSTKLLYRF